MLNIDGIMPKNTIKNTPKRKRSKILSIGKYIFKNNNF